MNQSEEIAGWLGQLIEPHALVEMRCLGVRGRKAIASYWRGEDLEAMAARAVEYDQAGAKGVYFGLNPVRLDLAAPARPARRVTQTYCCAAGC